VLKSDTEDVMVEFLDYSKQHAIDLLVKYVQENCFLDELAELISELIEVDAVRVRGDDIGERSAVYKNGKPTTYQPED